jgi:chromosome segregation ATPase
MNETSINNVAREHTNWLSSLESYKQELGKLKQRLTEIGGKIMGHDAALQLEQYENRFRVQQDNIDRLRHNIKENRNGFNRQSDAD